jgi:hypothetical protein
MCHLQLTSNLWKITVGSLALEGHETFENQKKKPFVTGN